MRLAYNTNGFPQHRLDDVCRILAEAGYDGIAITPDTFHLDPFGDGLAQAHALRPLIENLELSVALETGARFVLDARRKHWPTLLDEAADAERRLDLLRRCLDIAVALGAETFSFWSGRAARGLPWEDVLQRLCSGARALLDAASGTGVAVCFEPEPGMAVDSVELAAEFLLALGRDDMALMLDVGHVPVTELLAPDEVISALSDQIGGIQLDDSRDGVHEHLFFGDGEIDFPAVFTALDGIDYKGLAAVELPRHGHDPVSTARSALTWLRNHGA